MGLYNILIRPFVQKMDSERASNIALQYFKLQGKLPGGRFLNRIFHANRPKGLELELFGLNFYNPLGLGAGLDCRGDLYNDLNDLGFSFVEIGPLDLDSTRHAIENIQNDSPDDILAACFHKDFLKAFCLAYDFFDFFVFEMNKDLSYEVLDSLLEARMVYGGSKPMIVKLPEDIPVQELEELIHYCRSYNIDGIEARSAGQVRYICDSTNCRLPVIANTHINTVEQAKEMLDAGASLIEIRVGLVRQGPNFVGRILKYLGNERKNSSRASNK